MTAEILSKIEEMNRKGLNDSIIAEALYCSITTVFRGRTMLGLPRVGSNRTTKRYTIYDGKTTQYIMEGTAKECAEYMGVKVHNFHALKSKFRRGLYKKYEIHEVEA